MRRGRSNPEIADELGVSVNTVRYHLSNIFAKLGLTSRRELEQWDGHPRRGARFGALLALGWRGAAAGVGGVVFVAVVVVAIALPRDGEESGAPSALEVPGMAEYETFARADLETLGFFDAGPLLRHAADAPFESMVRAGFTVVRGPSSGFIVRQQPWEQGWSYPKTFSTDRGHVGASREVAGQSYYLVAAEMFDGRGIFGASACRLFAGGEVAGIAVEWRATQPGNLVLTLDAPELMLGACDDEGRTYLSAGDADGHVWIASEPVAADAIVHPTGQGLDTSSMAEVGRWRDDPIATYGTLCHDRCVAMSSGTGIVLAPIDGSVSCEPLPGQRGSRILLEGERWHLEFTARDRACPDEMPTSVSRGDPLFVPPSWVATEVESTWLLSGAWDDSGTQVDAVVTDDGRLFLGDAHAYSCPPCLPST